MNRRRLAQLLVGHALAEGTPAGVVLRTSRGPGAAAAAAEVDAGHLRDGLVLAQLDPVLAALAAAWPTALRPAQRRLAAMPSRRLLQIPLLQTLSYLVLLSMLQAVVLELLDDKVLPAFLAMMPHVPPEHVAPVAAVRGVVVVALVVLPVLIGIVQWAPIRVPGLGLHLLTAREAAIAAALDESGAPADVRAGVAASFRGLSPGHATAAELDRVAEQRVAAAVVAHQRVATAARVLGLGVLVVGALVITATLYQFVAWMPS